MAAYATCPYCGTTHFEPRSNCENCGAGLPPPVEIGAREAARSPADSVYTRSAPPMPPRPTPRGYLSRRLGSDSGAILGGVFLLLGVIFLTMGISLALTMDTSVTWVFIPLGLVFAPLGLLVSIVRLATFRRTLAALRDGQAALGRIESMQRDFTVEINGRSPWVIRYRFEVMGRAYTGKITTLQDPDDDLRPSAPVYVLYQPGRPEDNALYLDL